MDQNLRITVGNERFFDGNRSRDDHRSHLERARYHNFYTLKSVLSCI